MMVQYILQQKWYNNILQQKFFLNDQFFLQQLNRDYLLKQRIFVTTLKNIV